MVNLVALDSQIHRNVRIVATRADAGVRGSQRGERDSSRISAACSRIIRSSSPRARKRGRFEPAVLLGFQPQENLFFVDGRWDAAYVPLQIQRAAVLADPRRAAHRRARRARSMWRST